MKNKIGLFLICISISINALATAETDTLTECVFDKYFTKADAVRLKVEELKKSELNETHAKKKSSLRLELNHKTNELKKLRDQKKAYETLKKENFFNADEGLKTVFPDEYDECLR